MDLQITPEPAAEEKEAIELALRRLLVRESPPTAYASAWRQAGVREAVEAQAVARPRSSFGATRA